MPSAGSKKSEEVPNKGEQNRNWLPHHYLLWGPKEGGNAVSPMYSRGSPMPSAGSKKIRSGPQQRGTKSELAAAPLPSRGPKEGGNATSPMHSRGSPMLSAASLPRLRRHVSHRVFPNTAAGEGGGGCHRMHFSVTSAMQQTPSQSVPKGDKCGPSTHSNRTLVTRGPSQGRTCCGSWKGACNGNAAEMQRKRGCCRTPSWAMPLLSGAPV